MEDRFGAPASSTSGPERDSSAETARESGERIANSARDASNAVKDAAKDIAGGAREMANDVVGIAREQSADAASALKDRARTATDDVRQDAADQARTASSTLRRSAEGLDEELPWMRSALDKAADGIDHLSSALSKGDINETVHNVTEFARRQPALFMGLSVAVGFALARVGKTAVERAIPETTPKANGAAAVQPQNTGV